MTKTSLVETSLVAGAAQMLACRPRTVTVTKSKTTRISLGCYAEVPNEMAPLSIFPEGNAGSAQQEGTERAELNVRLEAAPTSPAFVNRHVFVRSKGEVVPSRWKRENREGAETVRHGEGRRRPIDSASVIPEGSARDFFETGHVGCQARCESSVVPRY